MEKINGKFYCPKCGKKIKEVITLEESYDWQDEPTTTKKNIKIKPVESREQIDRVIELEMRRYFGYRYGDAYCSNAVTGEEFEKLKKLILKCINLNKPL